MGTAKCRHDRASGRASVAPDASRARFRRLVVVSCLCAALLPAIAVADSAKGMTEESPSTRSAAEARAQPSLRLFRVWLAAFNSGDRTRYAKFLGRNFPSRAPLLSQEMAFRDYTGGLTLRRVLHLSAMRVSGWVQERDSDQFARFELTVSAGTPRKILSLDLFAIPRPAAFPIARLTESEAIAGVEALLRKRAATDRFSGAALLGKGGRVLSADAYGQADRERAIPNTLETRFRIGSMNKMFTAVATLQLVEAGRLALDDPVGKHLVGYPNKDVATKVTVRHLLTHTGGTGDIFGPEYDRNRLNLREHSDYLKLYGSRPPGFEPGSRFEYSNYGFVLLGAIVEAVTGGSYYDYVRENVFRPAGMTSTDSLPESEEVPNRSIGYMRPYPGAESLQPNTDLLPWRGTAAGGGYSTVGDLLRFADALTSHELLSPGGTEQLLAGKIKLGNGLGYAFGFVDERNENGEGWVGHGGGFPGMNGDLRIYPKSGYVVAVLANLDPPAAQRISDYLDPRLPLTSSSSRGAVVGAVGVDAAGTSFYLAPDATQKACPAGSVAARIDGKRVCLKAGNRCKRTYDRQYHAYGFHCHTGRLTRDDVFSRKVDVGGFRLAITCRGTGSPTVVLESGAGWGASAWYRLEPRLAKTTQVCSYDRAGLGGSDERRPPRPVPAARVVEELHLLLTRARIAPPYILGGWSLGGFFNRLYAKRYPSEVIGLVGVDGTPIGLPGNEYLKPPGQPPVDLIGGLGLPDSYYLAAAGDELAAAPDLGTRPLVLLTHGRADGAPAGFEVLWVKWQKEVARLSTSSILVRAENAGHGIQLDAPDLTAEAFRLVITAARTSAPLPACAASALSRLGGTCLDPASP
jgi:CubicO group peptidase (beta-lactamase class C family)/pimeloyl-ACP methyl ester carboxylesterase